jgi:hypothetical protein
MGSARPLHADAAKLCANFPDARSRNINLPPLGEFYEAKSCLFGFESH